MALRPGNVDRAAYRTKCRKKLSEYLCESSRMTCDRGTLTIRPVSKLGLSVEPGDVRLITTADDPYRWQPLPEKEHLFKKQLSKRRRLPDALPRGRRVVRGGPDGAVGYRREKRIRRGKCECPPIFLMANDEIDRPRRTSNRASR